MCSIQERQLLLWAGHASYSQALGFGRAARPYAPGTRLFELINMQKGALRAPPPPRPSLYYCHPWKFTIYV
jgi:hypothetical protein